MMQKLLFVTIMTLISAAVPAQNLNAGDIVVIGYAADTGTPTTSYNEFSWVPLVDLEAGTKVYFTDAGYNSVDANFMGTGLNEEILLRYIVPAEGIAKGTVMTVTEVSLPDNYTVIMGTKFGNDFNSLISLPNAGDQITVFQSTDDENTPATFGNTDFHAIFMVTGSTLSFTALNSATANITPVSNVDNLTNLVPGLVDGVNAVAVGTGPLEADETDNAKYTGTTTGTREEILFAVSQVSNWSRHDAAFGNDLAFGTTPNGWTTNGIAAFTVTGMNVGENPFVRLALYPNPTQSSVGITNLSGQKILDITLYGIQGEMVKKYDASQNSFDISSLASGTYFVEIKLEGTRITKKIIRN